jgi:hypothetical protein
LGNHKTVLYIKIGWIYGGKHAFQICFVTHYKVFWLVGDFPGMFHGSCDFIWEILKLFQEFKKCLKTTNPQNQKTSTKIYDRTQKTSPDVHRHKRFINIKYLNFYHMFRELK